MAGEADFRRIALSLERAVEGAHKGHPDFRANGRIFATLSKVEGADRGVLLLTPDEQDMLVEAASDVFAPVPGGWGRNSSTHILLAKARLADLKSGLARVHQRVMAMKPARPRKPKA